jgi:hypothetical protein
VVVHLEEPPGFAACCGLPWHKDPVERLGTTLWFCTGCANLKHGTHPPGGQHRYRIVCDDCGGIGTLRVSVDPATAPEAT